MTKLTPLQLSDAARKFTEEAWRKAVDARDTHSGCADWQQGQAEAYLGEDTLEDDHTEDSVATREGWVIIDKDETGKLEIQRDDDMNVFHADEDALAHVQRRATEGSLYHHHALLICKRSRDETPAEYECEVFEKLYHSFEMGKFTSTSPREAAQEAHDAFLNLAGEDYASREQIDSNDREVTVKRLSDGKEFVFSAGDDVEGELDEDDEDD